MILIVSGNIKTGVVLITALRMEEMSKLEGEGLN